MKYFFTLITFIFINVFLIYSKENSRWITAGQGLYMREAPDEKSKKIETIPYGKEVTFIEESGEDVTMLNTTGKWTKIEWNGKKGWVFGGFLNDEPQYNFFKLLDKVKKAKKGDIIKI